MYKGMLIDGRKIAEGKYEELKKKVARLSFVPVFADVVVGDDPVSLQYVSVKNKVADSIGVEFVKVQLPEDVAEIDVVMEIEKLSNMKNICGIIVQLPLPKGYNSENILNVIPTNLDVDLVGAKASENYYSGKSELVPPTAGAVIEVLLKTGIKLDDKKIVVMGKGQLVGKPVAFLLSKMGLNFQVVDRSTENPKEVVSAADVVISGIGQPGFITSEFVKPGSIVIDAGTAESAGQILGDVDTESVLPVAGFVSPVPGGVGPVTVAKLFENVLLVAESLDH